MENIVKNNIDYFENLDKNKNNKRVSSATNARKDNAFHKVPDLECKYNKEKNVSNLIKLRRFISIFFFKLILFKIIKI